MTTTLVRTGSAMAVSGLLVGMLSACTPEAKPSPQPTKTAAFATDEEAFAAAEETYRAFIHETNSENGDEEQYLGGQAVDDHVRAEQELDAAGLQGIGEATLSKFLVEPSSLRADRSSLTAVACLDISNVRVVNSDGQDVTPDGRPNIVALRVDMEVSNGRFLIFKEHDEDNGKCVA
jgi:hypothetical protein